jgi:ERCC4-type nuclease
LGYLTFKQHIVDDLYIVNYPNKEVENAFSKMMLGDYLHQSSSVVERRRMILKLLFGATMLKK